MELTISMNKNQAIEIVGSGLSDTSKMPSKSFNLSALDCITGSKLVDVEGSVCNGCYALNGNYQRYKLPQKMKHKTSKVNNPFWVEAMLYLIKYQGNKKDKNYFRWHDSGDLQSVEHLAKIVEVCEKTPNIKHWLPTREYKIVTDFLKVGTIPNNLIIRLSAHMVDTKPPKIKNINTSSVHDNSDFFGVECESYKQNNECLDCRKCWDKSISNISYKKH
jgi:hypothetical protein|tara:strand:+ start:38 stop:694 length:657 start_codon:yes stop_codon:yes gene_type:complete